MSQTRRFGALALALSALAVYQLRDVLFFGRAFFERDLLYYYFPWVEAFVRAISEGALPLRNPTTGFGQPMLGNPSVQALYPPTWLHLALPAHQAFALITLFHFLLGGTGAAALSWRLSRSLTAALFAGAFWMASGPFQSGLNVWHHFAGLVWMPWVLVAFDRLLEKPERARTRALGAAFGLQILAGSGDLAAMTLLLALLRLLCSEPEIRPRLARVSLHTLGALAIALALGAAMWMSVAELVRSSVRGRLSREVRTEWSIHPVAAGEVALPLQIASLPFTPRARSGMSEGRVPFLQSAFLGPLILPLLLAGLLTPSLSLRLRVFVGVGAVTAFLTALGKHGPLYDALIAILPPLAMFRYPSKALLPMALLACVGAGIGVEALRRRRERLLAGLAALFALAIDAWLLAKGGSAFGSMLESSNAEPALALLRSGLVLSALALTLFIVSLGFARARVLHGAVSIGLVVTLMINADINITVPEAVVRYRPAALPHVRDPSGGRLYSFDYLRSPDSVPRFLGRSSLALPGGIPGLDAAAAAVVVSRDVLIAPTAAAWGIEYAWDPDVLGLFDDTLRGIAISIQSARGPALLRLLQIASVSRVAALHAGGFEALPLDRALPVALPEPLLIYRVPGTLPRAYATSGVRVLSAREGAVAVLDPSFDPQVEAIVDDGVARSVSPAFSANVIPVERRSDRVTLDVDLNEPGEVVAVEGYLPGWRATVDGVTVPVRRANALFLAAEVPAGRHRVVFAYRPRGALVGAGLTVLTAAGLLLSLARVRSRPD